MRKLIFGGANSLDNFIARSDGAVDWLLWSDEAAEIMRDQWQRFDTMLMGRKTFEVMQAMNPAPKKKKKKTANTGIESYVFSRTLSPEDHEDVKIVSENAVEFVTALKREPGKDICLMGGGDLAKTFFEAGLIDEIGFNIHPVLLGSGVTLFHEMDRQIDLELIEFRTFKNGCIFALYSVKK